MIELLLMPGATRVVASSGHKHIEEDAAPLEGTDRKQELDLPVTQASIGLSGKHPTDKTREVLPGNRNRGLGKEIADRLHRVVPPRIFEVEKTHPTGRGEQGIVETEVRGGDPAFCGRGDLFDTAVNMAARIAAKAEGGEILASNVVRELVAGKEFLFSDRGETELRGFEDPVRVYEVRWHD